MNKVSVVSLMILSSVVLSACGNSGGYTQVPVRMTSVSVDSSLGVCEDVTRPQVKLQGPIEEVEETVAPTKPAGTVVLTPVKSTSTVKKDELALGDSLPEVKAPPAADNKTTTQPEKPKTKVGQLIDKVKNIFKKK